MHDPGRRAGPDPYVKSTVIRRDGAEELSDSLLGVSAVSDGTDAFRKRAAVACTLHSPIQAAENEPVENFSCELTLL